MEEKYIEKTESKVTNRFDELEQEIEQLKKENYTLHSYQQKLSRDIIIAIILIVIIDLFLAFCFKGFYDMSHDYAIGAMNMEEDYNTLKTRVISIENKLEERK